MVQILDLSGIPSKLDVKTTLHGPRNAHQMRTNLAAINHISGNAMTLLEKPIRERKYESMSNVNISSSRGNIKGLERSSVNCKWSIYV